LDFRLYWKEGREGEDLISIGIEFKTKGDEMLKVLLPNSVRHLSGNVGWRKVQCE